MRTIIFRGKCIQSNDWVSGDLIHGVGSKKGEMFILPNRFNLAYVKHCDPIDGVKVRPETITRALIMTCSRENDLVVVPFAGSGTECAMSAKENRNFVGFDIEHKFVEMSNKRCVEHLRTQSLFS